MNQCKNTCIHKKQPHSIADSLRLLFLFFLFLSYFILAYWLFVGQFYKNKHDAYVSGNLINISPLVQGRITELLVQENELVFKGQPIASIDKANAYLTLLNAKANLSISIKKIIEMNEITNELQSRAKSTLTNAENNLKKTQKTYKYYLDMKQENVIEKLKQAQISVEKAADIFEQANLEYHAAMSLPLDSDIYKNPIMHEAINQFRTAYLNWLKATVYAPDTGYIIARKINIGQAVNPNTILMTMVPLNEIWVNVNLKESDFQNIQDGQRVELIANIYKNNVIYEGTVIGFNLDTTQKKMLRIQIHPEQLAKFPLPMGFAMSAIIKPHKGNNHLTKINDISSLGEIINSNDQLAAADQLITAIVENNKEHIVSSKTQLGRL